MKFKRPNGITIETIKTIVLLFSVGSVLSAMVPKQMTTLLGMNVTQPSMTMSPFDTVSLFLGIPGFIIALLKLAGLLGWKAKHWKSRTPVVIR